MTAPQAKWGLVKWGNFKWGAGVPASTPGTTQGATDNALKSTVVMNDVTAPQTDKSQYATNLTASGVGAYETSSSRGAITSPRTLFVQCNVDIGTNTNKTLIHHGHADATDQAYRIGVDGSGDFYFEQNSTTLLTVASSDFTGGPTEILVQWSTRANPDSTGAADAVISEVAFYDQTNSSYHHYPLFTHAIATADGADTLTVGGYWDGAALQQGVDNTVSKWRVDTTDLHTAHFASHWVSERAGGTTEIDERIEPLPPTKASGLADQNEFTGPSLFYGMEHHRQGRFRMLSPAVNECYGTSASILTNSYSPAYWHKKPPGTTVYRWNIAWLRWLPVPNNCNYFYVRVLAHSTVTSGGSVPIGVRCYSFNRVPSVGNIGYGNEAPTYSHHFKGEKIDVDNGAGEGQWMINDLVRIQRLEHSDPKFNNTTHLCLAYAIDPDNESGNDAAEELKILAWQAWPVSFHNPNLPDNDGGIGG